MKNSDNGIRKLVALQHSACWPGCLPSTNLVMWEKAVRSPGGHPAAGVPRAVLIWGGPRPTQCISSLGGLWPLQHQKLRGLSPFSSCFHLRSIVPIHASYFVCSLACFPFHKVGITANSPGEMSQWCVAVLGVKQLRTHLWLIPHPMHFTGTLLHADILNLYLSMWRFIRSIFQHGLITR